ncbi:ATP-binding protein [Kitasatospora sp. NPDC015120]|uniref:ATP-binding protein n=1 Tax=Kitasatospora sp. NPDC015120 TaxID=3364023 RepID=UPI0036F4945F
MPHADELAPHPEENPGSRVPERAEPIVRTAREARAHLAGLLHAVARDTDRVLADAQLAVTELVVNARTHGGGMTGFEARLDLALGCLVVDVEDGHDGHPSGEALDRRDPAAPGGRGWALVQHLSGTCHVKPLPGGGKRIRVTFPL